MAETKTGSVLSSDCSIVQIYSKSMFFCSISKIPTKTKKLLTVIRTAESDKFSVSHLSSARKNLPKYAYLSSNVLFAKQVCWPTFNLKCPAFILNCQ